MANTNHISFPAEPIPGVDRPLLRHEAEAWALDWTARRTMARKKHVPFPRFLKENPVLERRVVRTEQAGRVTAMDYWLPEMERNRLLKDAGRL